jgi:hypothetical protein
MEEMIEQAVNAVTEMIAGFSLVDQARMYDEIAERLGDEAVVCMDIEYGFRKPENQGHENG